MTFEKFLAEILGTGILILLGDGVVAAVLLSKSKAQNAGWIVITWAWALAVFAGVVVAGPISGAHLNPAVTFGIYVQGLLQGGPGAMDIQSMLAWWVAEMIGAMIGAALVLLHYWDHFKATDDKGLKLAVFSTGPNIRNYWLNLVSEIIGTFVLVFVIFCGAGWQPITGSPAFGALPVALVVLVIGLSLGGTTGYAINPARDLGPRLIHFLLPVPGKGDSDWQYAWVPVVGPLIGGGLAAIVYYIFFTKMILPH
jgi:glycerol uptake facilitator protein